MLPPLSTDRHGFPPRAGLPSIVVLVVLMAFVVALILLGQDTTSSVTAALTLHVGVTRLGR
jgi:hypothetical protein